MSPDSAADILVKFCLFFLLEACSFVAPFILQQLCLSCNTFKPLCQPSPPPPPPPLSLSFTPCEMGVLSRHSPLPVNTRHNLEAGNGNTVVTAIRLRACASAALHCCLHSSCLSCLTQPMLQTVNSPLGSNRFPWPEHPPERSIMSQTYPNLLCTLNCIPSSAVYPDLHALICCIPWCIPSAAAHPDLHTLS